MPNLNAPYDIVGGIADQPFANETLLRMVVARLALYLPQTLAGSRANCSTPPRGATSLRINVNGVSRGSINFAPGSKNATFTFPNAVVLNLGDILEVAGAATVDPTFAGPTFTLMAMAEGMTKADSLTEARTISLTGDGTASGSFDGSRNLPMAFTLSPSGVTPGTYERVVVDAKGRVVGSAPSQQIAQETDTLASVTGRGAVTGRAISIINGTASNSATTGALLVTGGVGIGGDLHVAGEISGDFVARYADVAERYAANEPLAPGDVVELGGPAEIRLSTRDATTEVFGIISTAPALRLNADAGTDATHPYVVLTGRAPCRVLGPVRKGDRLVASAIPGIARVKAAGDAPEAVIGRALADFTAAEGLVEIAVGSR